VRHKNRSKQSKLCRKYRYRSDMNAVRTAAVNGKMCGAPKREIRSQELSSPHITASLAANLCALLKALPPRSRPAN